jgi:hypothetical protein
MAPGRAEHEAGHRDVQKQPKWKLSLQTHKLCKYLNTTNADYHTQARIRRGHRIPDHKSQCRNLHGHRYTVEITLVGKVIDGRQF